MNDDLNARLARVMNNVGPIVAWPDYADSLDLMAEIEAEIGRRGLQAAYVTALRETLGVQEWDYQHDGDLWLMVTAGPAMRAKAACQVLEERPNAD